MEEFLRRLRERKLVQWALAYGAGAFALLQGSDIVGHQFDWPEGVQRGITIALAVGFFVTVVVAWYHGEKGSQRVGSTELLLIALVLVIGGAVMWHFESVPGKEATTAAAAPAPPSSAASALDKSIAVLPFENLSADKDNAYFADGMQDEILTKLAKIGALRVVSRTSTRKYASHPDDIKSVALQLGVASILEGSVQKSGNAVHINVQLIRAATDEHLWAESYDRTLDNIFGVEGEVAQAVADALKAKLTGAEKQVVASKETQNPAALEAYLRGRALDNSGYNFAALGRALDFYQQAVREDPNYVQAWAAVTVSMSGMFQNGWDAKRSTPDAIREAADTALRLQPEAAESLEAQGAYFYRVRRDFPVARDFYLRALQKKPGDIDILAELFFIERRMSLWNESIAHFRETIARDPRNVSILTQGSVEIFFYLRRFDASRGYLVQALKIAPDDPTVNAVLAGLEQYLGRLDAADTWLAKVPRDTREPYEDNYLVLQMMYRRRFAELIARMEPVFRTDAAQWTGADFFGLIAAAWAETWVGQHDRARAHFERLREAIEATGGNGSANLMNHYDWQAPLVYAGLGDWKQADALARQAVAFAQGDTLETASAMRVQAYVYALHGDLDAAIAMLPGLLAMPCGPTPPQLALDPYWDPIRTDPRFVALTKQPITEYRIPAHE